MLFGSSRFALHKYG